MEAKDKGGTTLQISIELNLINKLKGKHWKQFESNHGAVMGFTRSIAHKPLCLTGPLIDPSGLFLFLL